MQPKFLQPLTERPKYWWRRCDMTESPLVAVHARELKKADATLPAEDHAKTCYLEESSRDHIDQSQPSRMEIALTEIGTTLPTTKELLEITSKPYLMDLNSSSHEGLAKISYGVTFLPGFIHCNLLSWFTPSQTSQRLVCSTRIWKESMLNLKIGL